MGLQEDTGTTKAQFNYLALVFYVTYLVFEIPQGYLMQRFPTAKYLGVNIILWGSKSFPDLPTSPTNLTPHPRSRIKLGSSKASCFLVCNLS